MHASMNISNRLRLFLLLCMAGSALCFFYTFSSAEYYRKFQPALYGATSRTEVVLNTQNYSAVRKNVSSNVIHSPVLVMAYTNTSLYLLNKTSSPISTLTMSSGGRMGNNMCQYAHLYLLGLYDNVKVGITQQMRKKLKMFEKLTISPFNATIVAKLNRTVLSIQRATEAVAGNKSVEGFIGGSPCASNLFWQHQSIWKQEFRFSTIVQRRVKERMQRLKARWVSNNPDSEEPVIVAAHVRRTDFVSLLTKYYSVHRHLPAAYYLAAFDYYRNKFSPVMFVVGSDDLSWCRRFLLESKDVVVVDKASAVDDMALLSSADNQIYSHGTFGQWILLLSSASTVVYPAEYTKKRYSHHHFLDIQNKTNFVMVKF